MLGSHVTRPVGTRRWRYFVTGAAMALVLVGCGDSDDSGAPFGPAGLGADDGGSAQDTGDGGSTDSGDRGLDVGTLTSNADPGYAVVEVEGGPTIEISAAHGRGSFNCDITDDRIQIGIGGSERLSLQFNARHQEDGWGGSFTIDSDEDPDRWIQYGGIMAGTLGLDVEAGEISYVGTATRQDRYGMADGDLDMPEVEVTVSVNCGLDHATAMFDNHDELDFDPFGTRFLTCMPNGPDDIDIDFDYQGGSNDRLEVDVRPDAGLIGHVKVEHDGGRWFALVSTSEGSDAGLTVDGTTVTFDGTFTYTPDGGGTEQEVDGVVTVTCPN